jgi:hypothetical protein
VIRPFDGPDPSLAPPSVKVAPPAPLRPRRIQRSGIAAAIGVLIVILTIAAITLSQTGANGHGTNPSPTPSLAAPSTKPAALPPPPTSAKPSPTPSPTPSRSPRRSPTHHATHTRTPTPKPPTSSSSQPSFPKPTATNLVVNAGGGGGVDVSFDVGAAAGQMPLTCHFYVDGSEMWSEACTTSASHNFPFSNPHDYYGRVSDQFGTYSDKTETVHF